MYELTHLNIIVKWLKCLKETILWVKSNLLSWNKLGGPKDTHRVHRMIAIGEEKGGRKEGRGGVREGGKEGGREEEGSGRFHQLCLWLHF
jgi:hypothetical protein